MSEINPSPASLAEPPADSFASRLVGVFTSPRQAFESIARRPDFLAPLITMTIAAMVVVEAMLQKVGAERIIQRSLEMSGKAAQMTPQQLDRVLHGAAAFTSISMRVGGVLGVPVFLVVVAALGLFIVNVVFGASVDFNKTFSVVCYANLVLLGSAALGLVMILLGDPEQFNPQSFTPTTVGFFLNPVQTPRALYVIASSFDIFRLWFILLTALGLSTAAAKKASTTGIFLIFLGIWTLIVLARAGIAAAMG